MENKGIVCKIQNHGAKGERDREDTCEFQQTIP